MAKGKKKIDEQYIGHISRELSKLVDDRFEGNQTRAAKALGMSQPHLSHLIAGRSGRGPGLQVLILLRMYTNRSVDSLLGLPPLPDEELSMRLHMALETEIKRIARDADQKLAMVEKKETESRIRALPTAPPRRKSR